MRAILTLLCCFACLAATAQPPSRQASNSDAGPSSAACQTLLKQYATYDNREVKTVRLQKGLKIIKDKSIKEISTSQNSEARRIWDISHKKKKIAFNPKKDNINFYIVMSAYTGYNAPSDRDGLHDILVVNKKGKMVDMTEFDLEPLTNNLTTETLEDGRKALMLAGTPEEYICGFRPREGKMRLVHKPSGQSTEISFRVQFNEPTIKVNGKDAALSVQKIINANGQWCRVTDLTTAESWLLPYPLHIDGSGKDGSDGINGYRGTDGANSYTWVDNNGESHSTLGMCGQAGGNGGNGGDGQNGGNIVVFLDNQIPVNNLTVSVKGGKAGKGGKGGRGGKHGTGSICFDPAPNGIDGEDGSPGHSGSQAVYFIQHESLNLQKTYKITVPREGFCIYKNLYSK